MSVNGSISDHNAFLFRTIRGPRVIQANVMTQIFVQNRSVQRADNGNIKCRRLFQKRLYLRTVLSDDPDKVSSGLVIPVFLHIKCSKLSEAIR